MKANEANLLKFLRRSQQFIIPIYQRNYSWTEYQCAQLWNDLLRTGRSLAIQGHFIGSIVYVERSLSTVTNQEALLVIDGQQRLTTSTLLIAALANYFESNELPEMLDSFSARKLFNYYLVNSDEDGERHYKLILSQTDKDTLLSILKKAPLPAEHSVRILQNYEFFKSQINKHNNEIEAICQGLAKLMIVEVSLDRTQDNPQLIFESMNSTGLELSQADLIRNYILMGQEPEAQKTLYETYWRPMEQAFGQEAYVKYFDPFMRDYLIAKTGDIPNIRKVYNTFKHYVQTHNLCIADLTKDIYEFASYYCAIVLGQESNPSIKNAFHDLRELKVDVAYPFLLNVYNDYKHQMINETDLISIVRLVESYVFRRSISGIPTNSLNTTFAVLSRNIQKEQYVESLNAAFLLLPSYRRFPRDDEFMRDIQQRDLYNFRNRNYWLRRLENHERKERISMEPYTIEHILPQNETLPLEWQQELGDDWQQVHQMRLHTLGNLTLTAYNSEYSDRPYSYKRDQITNTEGMKIGLRYSPLHLNIDFSEAERWDLNAIKKRAERLAKRAIKVWQVPVLDQMVLNRYRGEQSLDSTEDSVE